MVDELKIHLKKFDKALERMYKEKSDRADFEMLKQSVDHNRAKTIFNDMKELFDSNMVSFKEQLEHEKVKMREAFQYMLSETDEKCDRRDLKSFQHKIDKLES